MSCIRVKLMPSYSVDIIKIRPETEAYKEGIHLTPAERQPVANAVLRQSASCQLCGKLRVYNAIRNVSTHQRNRNWSTCFPLTCYLSQGCFASVSPDVKRGENEWKGGSFQMCHPLCVSKIRNKKNIIRQSTTLMW